MESVTLCPKVIPISGAHCTFFFHLINKLGQYIIFTSYRLFRAANENSNPNVEWNQQFRLAKSHLQCQYSFSTHQWIGLSQSMPQHSKDNVWLLCLFWPNLLPGKLWYLQNAYLLFDMCGQEECYSKNRKRWILVKIYLLDKKLYMREAFLCGMQ